MNLKNFKILLFVVAFLILLPAGSAKADSFQVDLAGTYYTFNIGLNKTTYAPGESIIASGSFYRTNCSNINPENTLVADISPNEISGMNYDTILNQVESLSYPKNIINGGSTTFLAPSTPGTYYIAFKGDASGTFKPNTWVNYSWIIFTVATPVVAQNTCQENWIAYTHPGYDATYIYLAKLPPLSYTLAGRSFSVYDPIKVIRDGGANAKSNLINNPSATILAAPFIEIAQQRWFRLIFNYAKFLSEPSATQQSVINGFCPAGNCSGGAISGSYFCTSNTVGATACHYNNLGAYIPGFETNGQLYVSSTDSSSITFRPAEIIGNYTINNCAASDYSLSQPSNVTITAGESGSSSVSANSVSP